MAPLGPGIREKDQHPVQAGLRQGLLQDLQDIGRIQAEIRERGRHEPHEQGTQAGAVDIYSNKILAGETAGQGFEIDPIPKTDFERQGSPTAENGLGVKWGVCIETVTGPA